MLADAAEQLAYPTMTCPVTGKPFKKDDVLELVTAASGFCASGTVQASIRRPSIN
jgi:nitric oxide synthase-interacting protein